MATENVPLVATEMSHVAPSAEPARMPRIIADRRHRPRSASVHEVPLALDRGASFRQHVASLYAPGGLDVHEGVLVGYYCQRGDSHEGQPP